MKLRLGDFARPGRRRERHGPAVIARREQEARPQRLAIGDVAGERFVEFALGFAAPTQFRPGFQGQAAVSGAINVERGANAIEVFGLVAPDQDPLNRVVPRLGGEQRAVQEQRDVGFALELVVEQQVPQLPTALRIMRRVVQAQFLDQPAFTPAGPSAAAIGADDVHFHLAGGVAAETRAVLGQHHLGAVPRGGKRRAHTRHAAAGHQDVTVQIHQGQMRFLGKPRVRRLGRSNGVKGPGNLGARGRGGGAGGQVIGAHQHGVSGGGAGEGEEVAAIHTSTPGIRRELAAKHTRPARSGNPEAPEPNSPTAGNNRGRSAGLALEGIRLAPKWRFWLSVAGGGLAAMIPFNTCLAMFLGNLFFWLAGRVFKKRNPPPTVSSCKIRHPSAAA